MSSDQLTSTGGWDTVSAMTYADMNKIIAHDHNYPDTFSESQTSGILNETTAITGNYSVWGLTEGGGGETVAIAAPVIAGSLTVTASGGSSTTVDLVGAVVTFEADLTFFDGPNNTQVLRVPTDPNAVRCTNVTFATAPGDPGVEPITQGLFDAWAKKNLKDFAQEFVSVDLSGGAAASNPNLAWLKPTSHAFVAAPATPDNTLSGDAAKQYFVDNSIMSVLTMTESRAAPRDLNISTTVIPGGSNAGFLISFDRYMSKMLLPHISMLFLGASQADFEVYENGGAIRNTNELTAQTMTVGKDNTEVKPKVPAKTFTVSLEDTYLGLKLTDFNFEWGVFDSTVHITYESTSTLSLDSDGYPEITLAEGAGNTTVTTNKIVDWVLIGVDVIAAALAIFGGACAVAKCATSGLEAAADGASAASGAIESASNSAASASEIAADSSASGSELAATVANDSSRVAKAAGWLVRVGKKVGVLVAVSGVTAAVGNIAVAVSKKEGEGKFPKTILNDLMKDASSPVVWPHFKDLETKSLAINGAIQFGGEVTFDV